MGIYSRGCEFAIRMIRSLVARVVWYSTWWLHFAPYAQSQTELRVAHVFGEPVDMYANLPSWSHIVFTAEHCRRANNAYFVLQGWFRRTCFNPGAEEAPLCKNCEVMVSRLRLPPRNVFVASFLSGWWAGGRGHDSEHRATIRQFYTRKKHSRHKH